MRKFWLALIACAAFGCGQEFARRPAPQKLPERIKKIAIRLVVNKTQQFGLEDALTTAIRDNFLRDGSYPLVPEEQADGVVLATLQRYTLTPVQYDSTLAPTAYKLKVACDLQFFDHADNKLLGEEKDLEGVQIYAASNLTGGLTETQAQAQIWDVLSRDIVKRVTQGFAPVPDAKPGPH
jgi:hypothetical protein